MIGRRIIGKYVITELLGEGGMGAVYTARHEGLDERFAVKVLHSRLAADEQIVQRFIAEARAASAIKTPGTDKKHPNIVKMVDFGQLDTGEHFIVMEYLDGYPVSKAAMPMAIEQALQILVQVFSGLEAAHAAGIIHRDLKPDNLFVSPQPHNPLFTKILDFGIAKLTNEYLAGSVKTRTDQLMGTPNYMSPEQVRATKEVDHLTDVYAMGAIAFELVTGKRAYEPTSIGDLAIKQANEGPRSPAVFRPELPAAWCQIIQSAMATPTMLRPQSVRDLAELLIAATPNGVELAKAVGFEARGGAVLPAIPAAGDTEDLAPGTPLAAQLTTLSGSAGVTAVPAVETGTRRRRSVLVGAVIGGLALAGGAVTLVAMSGGNDNAPATVERPETPLPEDNPAPRETVTLTIETEPVGAEVFMNGKSLGTSPVDHECEPGDELTVRAEKDGFVVASEVVTVSSRDKSVSLALDEIATEPDEPEPVAETDISKKGTTKAHKKTRPKKKPKADVIEPIVKPKEPGGFNPDDVGD